MPSAKLDRYGRLSEFGDFPTLETERLLLREFTLDDAGFYMENFSDPEVVEMTAFDAPATIEIARHELMLYCINPFKQNTGIRWGIVKKDERKLVGTIGFHDWIKADGYHARMGYDLLRDYRRQGIMTEAMIAAIDFGFDRMKLNRIVVHTDVRNLASQGLLKKLGFFHEGTLRANTYFHERFMDDMVFSVLEEEWRRTPSKRP